VDGGNAWEHIGYAGSADRSFAWTVANRFSSNAKVIVYAMSATWGMQAYDASAAFFTIAPAGTTVLPMVTPGAIGTWTAGTTQTVSWTVSTPLPASFVYFAIFVSLEDGRNGSWFDVLAYPRTSSWTWNIPATIGSAHARIVVYAMDAANQLLADATVENFAITPATGAYDLAVTAPVGGATLHVGAVTSVAWTTSGTLPPQAASYTVWYSVDGSLSWELAGTTAASPFAWTVPSRLSPSCTVMVVALDATNKVLGVTTSATFTIAP
jgi:hypothetical protein